MTSRRVTSPIPVRKQRRGERRPAPWRIVVAAVALLLPVAPGGAQEADTDRLRRDLESALLALGDRDALGSTEAPLVVSAPTQVRHELGAVVVPRADGAPAVLAVTPGGAAERMRLAPGDRLVSVNGTRLAGVADPSNAVQAAIAREDGALRVEYLRGGQPRSASGTADVVAIPAYRLVVGAPAGAGCGHATDTAGPLPRGDSVYRAQVTRIDGRSTPLSPVNRHRLEAGRHVLTVRELIDRSWLSRAEVRLIDRMQQRAQARAYKPLVLDVRPGTTYKIGARLLRDRLDPAGIRANAYWEPVVWEEEPARCE